MEKCGDFGFEFDDKRAVFLDFSLMALPQGGLEADKAITREAVVLADIPQDRVRQDKPSQPVRVPRKAIEHMSELKPRSVGFHRTHRK